MAKALKQMQCKEDEILILISWICFIESVDSEILMQYFVGQTWTRASFVCSRRQML